MRKIVIILSVLTLITSSCKVLKNSATHEKGVVINGVKWATRNVDEFGTFAKNPEDAGKLYQWNRKKAWNMTDEDAEDWDESFPEGTEWAKENCPCPKGWRVPTREELQKLVDAGSIITTHNGVKGRLFGSFPNQIFLPAADRRDIRGGLTLSKFLYGQYWSSIGCDFLSAGALTFDIFYGRNEPCLDLDNGFRNVCAKLCYNNTNGISIRCVAE